MLEETDLNLQKGAAKLEKLEKNLMELEHYVNKKSAGGQSPVSKTMNFSFSMVLLYEPRRLKFPIPFKMPSIVLNKDSLWLRRN